MKLVMYFGLMAGLFFFSISVHAESFFKRIGDLEWKDGENRFEMHAVAGTNRGGQSRSGDVGLVGSIEKEFPLYRKLSIGLRGIPLFLYEEDAHEGHTIWGAGGGFSVRYYLDEYGTGWYGEAQESVIIHTEEFLGNSSKINFISEFGGGYEFDNDWFLFAKWRHISNAGLARRNAGMNGVGLGLGLRF
jgi:hypothetical protein